MGRDKSPEVLDNVGRIRDPDPEEFWTLYVRPAVPVIVEGVYEGAPIGRLSTASAAREVLGELPFFVQWAYTSWLRYHLDPDEIEPALCTLDEYLEYVELNPDTPKMAAEQPAPPELMALVPTPAICRNVERTYLFVGNAGNYAHLHFDGDQRQVLMLQVFGKKRVTLIPPAQARKLAPTGNFSAICLQNMTEPDRRKFLEYAGAYETIVRAGECIFMPALYWHALDYTETSLSVHLRFGQNEYGRYFDDYVHRDFLVQNVAARYVDEAFAHGEGKAAFEEIKRCASAEYDSAESKHEAVVKLFRRLFMDLCPNAVKNLYVARDWDEEPRSGPGFYRALAERTAR